MNKISTYLVSGFLKTIFNFLLAFICLGVILSLFEEIEFFKNLDIGIGLPLLMTIMFIPNLMIKLLPFIVFLSAMWYIIAIRSNTDLLSLKVFGFSNLKIIFILAITAFLFGIFVLFFINPLTSTMVKYYEVVKAKYSKDIDHLVSINKNGVWIKENINNKLHITSAKKIEGDNLHEVTIYIMNNDNDLISRIESEKVNIISTEWVMKFASIYNQEENGVPKMLENFRLKSNYNIEKLSSLYKNLDTISFIDLLTNYNSLIQKGYTRQILNEKLNTFYSLPIYLLLMVVLASIFTIGSTNRLHNVHYVFIAIIICVIVYYFKDLSIALGQTNRISTDLAIWIPIIAISLFCSIGILQINEK